MLLIGLTVPGVCKPRLRKDLALPEMSPPGPFGRHDKPRPIFEILLEPPEIEKALDESFRNLVAVLQ